MHRLDRDTSGLMAVAASGEGHRELARQVRDREMERRYVALVEGALSSRTGTIDAPVGARPPRASGWRSGAGGHARRGPTSRWSRRCRRTPGGRQARHGAHAQIRTHFAAIGHPVGGDPRTGTAAAGLERQFLHASRLGFRHPRTGRR